MEFRSHLHQLCHMRSAKMQSRDEVKTGLKGQAAREFKVTVNESGSD